MASPTTMPGVLTAEAVTARWFEALLAEGARLQGTGAEEVAKLADQLGDGRTTSGLSEPTEGLDDHRPRRSLPRKARPSLIDADRRQHHFSGSNRKGRVRRNDRDRQGRRRHCRGKRV